MYIVRPSFFCDQESFSERAVNFQLQVTNERSPCRGRNAIDSRGTGAEHFLIVGMKKFPDQCVWFPERALPTRHIFVGFRFHLKALWKHQSLRLGMSIHDLCNL